MRFLTIERKKSYAACMATLKVYIEDTKSGDLTINGCQCRKLGTLKNGQIGRFHISKASAKVFVIADKISKDFCNDFYQLPASEDNVDIAGKCQLNPFAGNPFRFDKPSSPEVIKKRKKTAIIAAAVMVAAIVAGGLIGFAVSQHQKNAPAVAQDFTVDGMNITLHSHFERFEADGFNAGFESEDLAVLVLKEKFTLMAGLADYSLEDYSKLVLGNNKNVNPSELKSEQNFMYFEYDKANTGSAATFHYIVTMYKGTDAFWMIQYIIPAEKAEQVREDVFAWAATVTFTE